MQRLIRVFWWLPPFILLLGATAWYLGALQFIPDDAANLTPAELPAGNPVSVSITIPADVDIPEKPALLILQAVQNVSIRYADGSVAIDGGEMQRDPVARNKHRPLLFPLYKPALQAERSLQLEIRANPAKQPQLKGVYFGDATTLEAAWKKNNWLRQGIVKALIAVLVVASLLIFSIWLFLRENREYFWYATGTLFWGLHSLNLVTHDIRPFSDAVWDGLVPLVIGLSILSIITMVYYFMSPSRQGHYQRWLHVLWVVSLALALPLFLPVIPDAVPPDWFNGYRTFWFVFLSIPFSLVLAYVIHRYWLRQSTTRLLFVMAGFAMLIFGLHDMLLVMGSGQAATYRNYLLHFAAVFALLTQYVLLVRRFIGSLRKTRYYANHLEELVAKREQQLRENYEKMRVLEQEKAIVDERERIMRDIHDGFGGHLVSTLAMLERPNAALPEVKQNIQDALADLRLVIDSLDFDSQDITTALGMFRSRNMRKIKQAGYDLKWGIQDIETPPGFGAEKTLQLLRIVQEAITNCLKHCQGDTITVSTGTGDDGYSFVQVEDNGRGIPDSYQAGKGLASMRKRADRIGADIDISNNASGRGARVRITLKPDDPAPRE